MKAILILMLIPLLQGGCVSTALKNITKTCEQKVDEGVGLLADCMQAEARRVERRIAADKDKVVWCEGSRRNKRCWYVSQHDIDRIMSPHMPRSMARF